MPADSKSPLPAPAAIVASPVAGGGGGAAAKAKSDQKSVAGAAMLWSAGIPSDVLSSFTVDGIRDLGDGLIVRRLAITDYARGYTKLLSQLTTTGNITREEFEARFRLVRTPVRPTVNAPAALNVWTFRLADGCGGLLPHFRD